MLNNSQIWCVIVIHIQAYFKTVHSITYILYKNGRVANRSIRVWIRQKAVGEIPKRLDILTGNHKPVLSCFNVKSVTIAEILHYETQWMLYTLCFRRWEPFFPDAKFMKPNHLSQIHHVLMKFWIVILNWEALYCVQNCALIQLAEVKSLIYLKFCDWTNPKQTGYQLTS